MSMTQNDDRDNSVVEELEKLPDGTKTGTYFARALELGASPALLGRIATGYRTYNPDNPYTVIGLPYIEQLLAAGWNTAQVREFLHDQCFNEQYETCSYHRQPVSYGVGWKVFNLEQLVEFLKELAATYEGRHFLTPEGHDNLMVYLFMARDDEQQNLRDIRAIEAVAASHLTFIENEYQLSQMIRYSVSRPAKDLAYTANNVATWGWSLIYKGYVLAKLPSNLSYETSLITRAIYEQLDRNPDQAAQAYRWLVEGFWREHNQYWMFRVEDSHIRSPFTSAGWHFLQATATPSGELQVVLPGKGTRTIVRHMPGTEELVAGDEVMIHRDQLKDLRPSVQPGCQIYQLTLAPARRPTAEMLADVRGQFPSLVTKMRQKKSA